MSRPLLSSIAVARRYHPFLMPVVNNPLEEDWREEGDGTEEQHATIEVTLDTFRWKKMC